MYVAFTLLIFLASLVMQTTVFEAFGMNEVKPDLVLVIVVYIGLVRGSDVGCTSGFFFGLTQDVFSAVYVGTNALAKTILGFVSGVAGKRLYTQSLFSHILCVASGTLLNVLLNLSINGFIPQWGKRMALEVIYNLLCCPLIVWIFRYAETRLGVLPPARKR